LHHKATMRWMNMFVDQPYNTLTIRVNTHDLSANVRVCHGCMRDVVQHVDDEGWRRWMLFELFKSIHPDIAVYTRDYWSYDAGRLSIN
jgi:hypothetical protein